MILLLKRKRFLFISLFFSIVLPMISQSNTSTPLTRENVQRYMDRIIPDALQQHHIPGAAIAVVHNGEVLFIKGYGWADYENRIPVDAHTTMFQAASAGSKPLTALALMTLLEQKNLPIATKVSALLPDADYLPAESENLTLKDLLSHTTGIADPLPYSFNDPDRIIPLSSFLEQNPLIPVRKPGQVTAYSNLGYLIAGRIIEVLSDMDFNSYMMQFILNPLQMSNTTFNMQSSIITDTNRAKGYRYVQNRFIPDQPYFTNFTPAGALYTTAADMANYMQVYLNEGRFGGHSVFANELFEEMKSPLFSNSPGLNGNSYGLWQSTINGVEILEHGGSNPRYVSQLWLAPEHKLGLFLLTNSDNGSALKKQIRSTFFDRFYPEDSPAEAPERIDVPVEPGSMNGLYRSTVSNLDQRRTWRKIFGTLIVTHVRQNPDGSVETSSILGGQKKWNPVGPGTFSAVDDQEIMKIQKDQSNMTRFLFMNSDPDMAWTPIHWSQSPIIALSGNLLMLIIGISGIVIEIIRIIKKEKSLITMIIPITNMISHILKLLIGILVIHLGMIIADDLYILLGPVPNAIIAIRILLILLTAVTTFGFIILIGRKRKAQKTSRSLIISCVVNLVFTVFLFSYQIMISV